MDPVGNVLFISNQRRCAMDLQQSGSRRQHLISEFPSGSNAVRWITCVLSNFKCMACSQQKALTFCLQCCGLVCYRWLACFEISLLAKVRDCAGLVQCAWPKAGEKGGIFQCGQAASCPVNSPHLQRNSHTQTSPRLRWEQKIEIAWDSWKHYYALFNGKQWKSQSRSDYKQIVSAFAVTWWLAQYGSGQQTLLLAGFPKHRGRPIYGFYAEGCREDSWLRDGLRVGPTSFWGYD